jgi:hypothetical protein
MPDENAEARLPRGSLLAPHVLPPDAAQKYGLEQDISDD